MRWVVEEKVVNKNQKRVREAVILDNDNDAMPISLWQQYIDQVEEESCRNITNVSIKVYLISKLSTTKSTVISVSGDLP